VEEGTKLAMTITSSSLSESVSSSSGSLATSKHKTSLKVSLFYLTILLYIV
jgi:hypothetical protein